MVGAHWAAALTGALRCEVLPVAALRAQLGADAVEEVPGADLAGAACLAAAFGVVPIRAPLLAPAVRDQILAIRALSALAGRQANVAVVPALNAVPRSEIRAVDVVPVRAVVTTGDGTLLGHRRQVPRVLALCAGVKASALPAGEGALRTEPGVFLAVVAVGACADARALCRQLGHVKEAPSLTGRTLGGIHALAAGVGAVRAFARLCVLEGSRGAGVLALSFLQIVALLALHGGGDHFATLEAGAAQKSAVRANLATAAEAVLAHLGVVAVRAGRQAGAVQQELGVRAHQALLVRDALLAVVHALLAGATDQKAVDAQNGGGPPELTIWARADALALGQVLVVAPAFRANLRAEAGVELVGALHTLPAFFAIADHVVALRAGEAAALLAGVKVGAVATLRALEHRVAALAVVHTLLAAAPDQRPALIERNAVGLVVAVRALCFAGVLRGEVGVVPMTRGGIGGVQARVEGAGAKLASPSVGSCAAHEGVRRAIEAAAVVVGVQVGAALAGLALGGGEAGLAGRDALLAGAADQRLLLRHHHAWPPEEARGAAG
mmetsp:Transcript_108429/g.258791  ORF Transcript_108429/g.258791 Transcript_108429/m.258791 type:complete len:554 (+) Transcript_108429:857-2518(+)